MIVLGLILMLACAAVAADAVVQNTHVMHATAFNQPVSHLSLGAIFVAGAVVGLVFAWGLMLVIAGMGRRARKRRERMAAAQEARTENEALRERNQRLASELHANRADGAGVDRADGAEPVDAGDSRLAGRHRAG